MGKYHKSFEPFISFLSISWTRPTLQLLNKDPLEVLLIEGAPLALVIFSLRLRRKIAQDYQALLVDIFQRQNFTNSQETIFFFSKLQTLPLFASTKKWLSREQNFQTLKNFQSSNLGFFPLLLVPNICESQTFHFFDCLWRLNLKFFKMKKQIWLHVFNDFKSFLAKGVELTFKCHDWRKEVVQRISLCSFKIY